MKKKLAIFFAVFGLVSGLAFAAAAQTVNVSKKKADSPVKIVKKPVVKFGRCAQSSGVARLRVTFDKSAQITAAVVVQSSGCEEFDNNALKAARGIKFEPAVKDGEPVTVTKPVEYQFTVY